MLFKADTFAVYCSDFATYGVKIVQLADVEWPAPNGLAYRACVAINVDAPERLRAGVVLALPGDRAAEVKVLSLRYVPFASLEEAEAEATRLAEAAGAAALVWEQERLALMHERMADMRLARKRVRRLASA